MIEFSYLIDAGLICDPAAAERRKIMGELLGIGYCNGKQFFKRLTVFKISREEFLNALERLEDTENE